jgi:hypothetical protein
MIEWELPVAFEQWHPASAWVAEHFVLHFGTLWALVRVYVYIHRDVCEYTCANRVPSLMLNCARTGGVCVRAG